MDDALAATERARARSGGEPHAAVHSRRWHQGFLRQHTARRGARPARCAGIVAYEPTELVITARAGTPLAELEARARVARSDAGLRAAAFRRRARRSVAALPPASPVRAALRPARPTAACAISCWARGCSMAAAGLLSFRRHGHEERRGLRCIARCWPDRWASSASSSKCRSRCLPSPPAEATLRFEMSEAAALDKLNAWGGRPLPISASAWHGRRSDSATFRRGRRGACRRAAALGGEVMEPALAASFWRDVREHTDDFFAGTAPLWRVSVPSTAAVARARRRADDRMGRGAALAAHRNSRQNRSALAHKRGGSRHAVPRWRPIARSVHAAEPPTGCDSQAPEGAVRSGRYLQSGPHVPGSVSRHANKARRLHQGHCRRQGSSGHPRQLRALRFLHGHLSDVSAARRRTRRTARPHLSDQAGARRSRAHREDATASRPMPHLPRLRNHLSFGRAVRPAARHRPQAGR